MEQIYKRLQNGETSEAIAEEFTKALNDAMARFEAEEQARKEEEARRMKAYAEQRAREDAKRNDLISLLDSAFGFIAKWYPEAGLTEGDWDEEDIAAIANLVLPLLDIEVAKGVSKSKKVPAATAKLPVKVSVKKSDEEIISDFFKSLGM